MKHSTAVQVVNLLTGDRYASMTEAARAHGVTQTTMRIWLADPTRPFVALGLTEQPRRSSRPVVNASTGARYPSIKAASRAHRVTFAKMKAWIKDPRSPFKLD